MLPFTHDQFAEVFAAYNVAVWPAQVVAYAVGLAACAGVARRTPMGAVMAASGLAGMWIWSGLAYHIAFFTRINPAAYAFGSLFVLEGLLLGLAGATGHLRFGEGNGARAWWGWGLVGYALVVYPLAGMVAGPGYPSLPMFGITPCPVTLFTFGLFLLAAAPVPWWLVVIPAAWALVGGSAAFLLAIPQDWPLLVSVLALLPILRAKKAAPRLDG